jgi:competence protein ComEA
MLVSSMLISKAAGRLSGERVVEKPAVRVCVLLAACFNSTMITDENGSVQTPAPAGQPKILGLSAWKFFACLAVLVVVLLWKTGLMGKLFASGPVNVNTATMEQLVALPDVDKKIAADIVSKRPYTKIEDLLKVKGIGEKRLEKLRDKVVISDPPK